MSEIVNLFIQDVNAIISVLPCEIMSRFDKVLISKQVIHIAITSNCNLICIKARPI